MALTNMIWCIEVRVRSSNTLCVKRLYTTRSEFDKALERLTNDYIWEDSKGTYIICTYETEVHWKCMETKTL